MPSTGVFTALIATSALAALLQGCSITRAGSGGGYAIGVPNGDGTMDSIHTGGCVISTIDPADLKSGASWGRGGIIVPRDTGDYWRPWGLAVTPRPRPE